MVQGQADSLSNELDAQMEDVSQYGNAIRGQEVLTKTIYPVQSNVLISMRVCLQKTLEEWYVEPSSMDFFVYFS
jgi:hypothetical protein